MTACRKNQRSYVSSLAGDDSWSPAVVSPGSSPGSPVRHVLCLARRAPREGLFHTVHHVRRPASRVRASSGETFGDFCLTYIPTSAIFGNLVAACPAAERERMHSPGPVACHRPVTIHKAKIAARMRMGLGDSTRMERDLLWGWGTDVTQLHREALFWEKDRLAPMVGRESVFVEKSLCSACVCVCGGDVFLSCQCLLLQHTPESCATPPDGPLRGRVWSPTRAGRRGTQRSDAGGGNQVGDPPLFFPLSSAARASFLAAHGVASSTRLGERPTSRI